MQAIDDAPTRSANEGSWVPSSVGYNGGQQIGSSTTYSRATATWKAHCERRLKSAARGGRKVQR
ncbi:MAG: hypothetical protein ACK5SI_11210, partial [Planctomycetia bacterium]